MIYDITQPLFECTVFPGDDQPKREEPLKIERGDVCNLTNMYLCVHNGTHVDAPYHFINDGKGIDKVSLEKFIGPAYVEEHDGLVTGEDAKKMLETAKSLNPEAARRILIKGKATVSAEAAKVFAEGKVDLVGNESQTVGPENAPKEVHMILLGAEVVLLEGIRLAHVPDGLYNLSCPPLNLSGADGSPVRALLFDL